MSRRLVSTLVTALILSAAACTGTAGARVETRPRLDWSSTSISAPEIATSSAQTALDAVNRLRPGFLDAPRASFRQQARVVYLDGMKLGGIAELRTIPASMVSEIRLLSGVEATLRYGSGHGGGALEVVTFRR